MKRYILFFFLLMLAAVVQAAPVKVASLHPLLTDMATAIGGGRVKVIPLYPEDFDLHKFAPDTEAVSTAIGSKMILFCGKGVEDAYKDTLKESFGSRTVMLDLGKDIPDVAISPDSTQTDPHWWNDPENMKTAAALFTKELSKLDPAGKAEFKAALEKYTKGIDTAAAKARTKMDRLPEGRKLLVTSHAGMAHFCKAFGLTPCPIGSDADLDALAADLKGKGVVCMFYDASDLTDTFEALSEKVGCKTKPLFMDGVYPSMKTYTMLFSINTSSIYNNLRDKEAEAAIDAANREKRREEIQRRFEESKNKPKDEAGSAAPAGAQGK